MIASVHPCIYWEQGTTVHCTMNEEAEHLSMRFIDSAGALVYTCVGSHLQMCPLHSHSRRPNLPPWVGSLLLAPVGLRFLVLFALRLAATLFFWSRFASLQLGLGISLLILVVVLANHWIYLWGCAAAVRTSLDMVWFAFG